MKIQTLKKTDKKIQYKDWIEIILYTVKEEVIGELADITALSFKKSVKTTKIKQILNKKDYDSICNTLSDSTYLLIYSSKLSKPIPTIWIKCKHTNTEYIEKAIIIAIREGIKLGYKSFYTANIYNYESAIIRGAIWGSYKFITYKTTEKKLKPISLTVTFSNKINQKLIKEGKIQGKALVEIADLANSPSNIATPTQIALWSKSIAKKNNLIFKSIGRNELIKKKYGGILSVSKGSKEEPKMIILKHLPNTSTPPIIIIGKTVTFDTGGISLKASKDMGWMRYDKSGGMAILAIMQSIAQMKINTPVIGILGAAENMPSGTATKPGDIVKIYKGKTVEVLNTDAEGRLILADALGLASDFKPRCIVDIATLTGAVIATLGYNASAILGNDKRLIKSLIDAGSDVGEKLWQLPIYDEFKEDMKSDFADLSNLSKSGSAGTATAAAFLNEFIPNNIPWAHLDIAGTAWKTSNTLLQDPGATLFSVRLIVQWLSNIKKY